MFHHHQSGACSEQQAIGSEFVLEEIAVHNQGEKEVAILEQRLKESEQEREEVSFQSILNMEINKSIIIVIKK